MKILRVFPQRTSATPTDDMALIGPPPLFRPEADEVHVSCVFSWDLERAKQLRDDWSQYYDVVKLGGPAVRSEANGFVAGRYLKLGHTITTRGCPGRCPWCIVPEIEGNKIKCLPIQPGWIIQDNNLLAAPRSHIESVFQMLTTQRRANFPGGLDARRFRAWHLELLRTIKIHEVWFAYDSDAAKIAAIKAISLCVGAGLRRWQVRCYVLVGFQNDTPKNAESRLEAVYAAGGLPFAMLFHGANKPKRDMEWNGLIRTWARPAAMAAIHRDSGLVVVGGE